MPSLRPMDWGQPGVGSPRYESSPMLYASANIGQWTANATKTRGILNFPRGAVIREVWISADAIPSDADGTMLVNVKNNDISEGPAADSLVTAFDAETVILVANKAYQASLVAETSENEQTVETQDVLYVELVSNSAAIDTNANVTVMVGYQVLEPIGV